MNENHLAEKHSFINGTVFRLKVYGLTVKRFLENLLSPLKRFKDEQQLIDAPLLSSSESMLWNPDDRAENWILTAGKVENLRIAAKKINGLEIKANETFSFWRHIGNPNIGKGYVIGREVREGCIVPTIAGGLCQLSNALYDAALKANFEIIERHKHTKVIRGSLAEQDRDATVKWNYVDLRFRSADSFRIEVVLDAEKLSVRFKGESSAIKSKLAYQNQRQFDKLNDCYSCGNTTCFKHPSKQPEEKRGTITTFILDEKWPEFDRYVKSAATEQDHFIIPLKKGRFIKSDRYNWSIPSKNVSYTKFQGVYRALKLRFAPKNKNNVFELMLQLDKKIALAAASHIPIDSTHLVISQNLLPFVYQTGALGGRTFDVLMTRLPLKTLHQNLDTAFLKHPESPTLKDFRASDELVSLETQALTKARKIISPHTEIAAVFSNKIEKLNWHMKTAEPRQIRGKRVLFPASAVGRKGAYEMRALALELGLELKIIGRSLEQENFWEGVDTERFNGNFDTVDMIVYPAFVENQPRQILRAISEGVPVITTTACGISDMSGVKTVEPDNFEGLRAEVIRCIGSDCTVGVN